MILHSPLARSALLATFVGLSGCSSAAEELPPFGVHVSSTSEGVGLSWSGGPVHFVEVTHCFDGCEATTCDNGHSPFDGATTSWQLGEHAFDEPLKEATITSPLTYGSPTGNLDPEFIPLESGEKYAAILIRYVEVDDDEAPIEGQLGCAVFVAP